MVNISPILGSAVMGWEDIYLSAFILCVLVFLVYKECMSAGLSKDYVDNYIVTAVISTLGCHCFFILVQYSTKTKVKQGVPYLNFLYQKNQHFIDAAVSYLTDFTLLLAIVFISTLPFIFLYVYHFRHEMEFEINRILIPSYIRTLQILLVYAVVVVFCSYF